MFILHHSIWDSYYPSSFSTPQPFFPSFNSSSLSYQQSSFFDGFSGFNMFSSLMSSMRFQNNGLFGGFGDFGSLFSPFTNELGGLWNRFFSPPPPVFSPPQLRPFPIPFPIGGPPPFLPPPFLPPVAGPLGSPWMNVWGDPHVKYTDSSGKKHNIDITGNNGSIYNMLDDAGLRINARLGQGTTMRELGITAGSDRLRYAYGGIPTLNGNPFSGSTTLANGNTATWSDGIFSLNTNEYNLKFLKDKKSITLNRATGYDINSKPGGALGEIINTDGHSGNINANRNYQVADQGDIFSR